MDRELGIDVLRGKSAFKGRLRTYILQNKSHIDPVNFFKDAFVIFKRKIRKALLQLHSIKVNTCLTAKFKRTSFTNENTIDNDNVSGENSNSVQNNQSTNNDNDKNETRIEMESDSESGDDSSETDSQSEVDVDESENRINNLSDESENDLTKISFNGDDDNNDDNNIENDSTSNNDEIITFYLQTKSKDIIVSTDLKSWFKSNVIDVIMCQIDELQENGSGWSLHEVVDLTVNINKNVIFSASSYIPLPSDIDKNKKCIVNVKNDEDSKCFLWSVLAALHPKHRDAGNINHYKKYENELNLDGVSFPASLESIRIFEKQNENISINVYVISEEFNHEKKKVENIIVPVRLTDNVKSKHIHLLMIHENNKEETENSDIESENEFLDDSDDYYVDECDETDYEDEFFADSTQKHQSLKYLIKNYKAKTHYCWIKNLSGLIQAQVTQVNRNKKYLCDICLHYFYTEKKLSDHIVTCKEINKCKVTLPTEEHKWLKFQNHQFKLENQFIVYADIESLLVEPSKDSSQPKGAYEEHKAFSVGYYFHSRCSKLKSYYKSNTSETDAVDWFVNELFTIAKNIWKLFHECEDIKMDKLEKRAFKTATVCHICEKPFECNEEKGKVRDHDHFSGKFR